MRPEMNRPPYAFLVIYLGPLPDYFPYWAKTCLPNSPACRFFVYTDQVDHKKAVNDAVTLVPYSFSELCRDAQQKLSIRIHKRNTRIVCDCRVLLYELRKQDESLDRYDMIGYTDLDVIYGQIDRFLPENPTVYSMISAHDNRPCGPFTLFNRTCLPEICRDEQVRGFFESQMQIDDAFFDGEAFCDENARFMPMSGNTAKDRIAGQIRFFHLDESDILTDAAKKQGPVYLKSDPLQPTMTPHINHRKAIAFWDNGGLTVRDIWGRKKQGAVFHFSRFKNRSRFRITQDALSSDRLGIYKYGIISSGSLVSRIKMGLTLLY